MMPMLGLYHRAAATVLAGLACLVASAAGNSAAAQARLRAHYQITMTGVPIGQIAWFVSIGEQRYVASANGKASGVLSVLVNGEGSTDTRGIAMEGRLVPKFVTSKISDDEGNSELRMIFDDDGVKDLIALGPPPKDRVPVSAADRRGVVDPLTAMLMPAGGDAMAPANCSRVLPIFDGRRRYDLTLTFKRIDRVSIVGGYSGFVLVCGVVLKPVAGYRADSMLVKYVAGRSDIELWFAPIAGTSTIARSAW